MGGQALHQKRNEIFFSKCFNILTKKNSIFFSSEMFKLTWKMRNELNQKKNQILDFSDFYFSSYSHFCDVITPIFDEFFTKTHLWPTLSFLFPNRCMLNFSHWNRSINEDFSYFQRGLFNKFMGNFLHFYFWIPIYRNHRIFIDYLLAWSWSYLVCWSY